MLSPPGRRRLPCHVPYRGGFRPGPPTPVVRRVAGPRGTAGVLGAAQAGGGTEEVHRGRSVSGCPPVPVEPCPRGDARAGGGQCAVRGRWFPGGRWHPMGQRTACRARAVVPLHGWPWGRRPVGPWGPRTGGAGLRRMGGGPRADGRGLAVGVGSSGAPSVPHGVPDQQRLVACRGQTPGTDHLSSRVASPSLPRGVLPQAVSQGAGAARSGSSGAACVPTLHAARSVRSAPPRDVPPWSVCPAWGRAAGAPSAAVPGAWGPNIALEPTPTAFARPSLRLLVRLTAGVRLQWEEDGRHTIDPRRCSCGTAPLGSS